MRAKTRNKVRGETRLSGEFDLVVGARIEIARLRAELSQDALARRLNISLPLMRKYERGEAPIPASALFMAGQACGVDAAQLLPDAEGAKLHKLGVSNEELNAAAAKLSPEGRRVLARVAAALSQDPTLGKQSRR